MKFEPINFSVKNRFVRQSKVKEFKWNSKGINGERILNIFLYRKYELSSFAWKNVNSINKLNFRLIRFVYLKWYWQHEMCLIHLLKIETNTKITYCVTRINGWENSIHSTGNPLIYFIKDWMWSIHGSLFWFDIISTSHLLAFEIW